MMDLLTDAKDEVVSLVRYVVSFGCLSILLLLWWSIVTVAFIVALDMVLSMAKSLL